MKFYQILGWMKRNLCEIILSQRKTFAYLIFGMIESNKASVIGIARGMKSNTTVRHNVKRVARFMANERIDVDLMLLKLQRLLIAQQKESMYILLDWTTISNRGYQMLKATIIGDGRGIPFYFKTYKEGEIKDNQTKYEKDFITKFKSIIPDNIKVYIIADRGFGLKPELLKHIEKQGYYYIARVKEDILIRNKDYNGKLRSFKTESEKIYELKDCEWPGSEHKKKEVYEIKKNKSRFILIYKNNFKERWSIATNDDEITKEQVVIIYSKRMRIEQTFKDAKGIDRGLCLERIKLSSAIRYDKMMLIICYVFFFLTLLGCLMEQKGMHRHLMANTVKYRSISLYQVGRYYYKFYDISIPKIIKLIPMIIYRL